MKSLFLTLAMASLAGCSGKTSDQKAVVIPTPNQMELTQKWVKASDEVTISIDSTLPAEGYVLDITNGTPTLKGGSGAGVQYGLTTLEQLKDEQGMVPVGKITDSPRFAWRGFMFDVSRHFQPKERIIELLDILAYHKINKFHWHLTDGIGWRIEIEKYPELTKRGAWRKVKAADAPWVGLQLSEQGAENTYGGYYTKEDIKEVIDYATKLNIEVIPEIEMPGHSEAATFCYPEHVCEGAKAGSGVYCAGDEDTYEFLFGILDAVMELFPSKYIHIGGDEVGKGQWAACPVCQGVKKREGLKDEHELQSYFIGKVNDYVRSKGETLIGWDEITEGGLAGGAVVMSWTGYHNGVASARKGNQVVMCPLDYVYFDHYQGYNNFEKQAWGGLNDLKRVYDFAVIPDELETEFHKNIMGGQANLWTENISTWEHAQYMLLPRLAALSEALWCGVDNKDWERFAGDMQTLLARYKARGWNYAESAYTPRVESVKLEGKGAKVKIFTELPSTIHYTVDGSEPTASSAVYDSVILVEGLTTIKAQAFNPSGEKVGYPLTLKDMGNLATGKTVSYTSPFNEQYNGGGATALTDGKYAVKRGDDKSWQGFQSSDVEFVIDLGSEMETKTFETTFFQHIGSTSVMLPLSVSVEGSVDGENFELLSKADVEGESKVFDAFVKPVSVSWEPSKVRYLRVKAENMGTLPKDIMHPRGGDPAWVFLDELIVK